MGELPVDQVINMLSSDDQGSDPAFVVEDGVEFYRLLDRQWRAS